MTTIQVIGKVNKKLQFLAQMPSWVKEGAYQVVIVILPVIDKTAKPPKFVFSDHYLPIEAMTFSRSEIYDEGK